MSKATKMGPSKDADYLVHLVRELCALTSETEWVEFKRNWQDNRQIGEYVSALSNAAVLAGKTVAYLVWGIADGSHEVVGTEFSYRTAKEGNEVLENWLVRLLSPRLHLRFHEVELEGKRVVILEIPCAFRHPVQFQGQEFIRIGSVRKNLKEHPEIERALWRALDRTPSEERIAAPDVRAEEVLRLLDHAAFFELLGMPIPEGSSRILKAFQEDRLVTPSDSGGWNVTYLGAVLLARKLSEFEAISRKAVRVVVYAGNNRTQSVREQVGTMGYATGFEGLISFINGLLPANEIIGQALRKSVSMYPEIAIRELVANALIHQDFFVTGAGPMIEIFGNRMEISNPGAPLVAPERFLDNAPRSRNERLAALMRRFGICEERGSGVDKVVFQIEAFQLPPPLFEVSGEATRVVLFASQKLSQMEREDRIRACYQHACLRYVNREHMTNSSIRMRFGIDDQNIAQASRIIREAVEAEQVLPYDANAAPKLMRYVPWWAKTDTPAST